MATKTVLVTGANGFIAAHILNVLLDSGYCVKGTVRSDVAANKVKLTHGKHGTKLSLAIVPDIEVQGAFDKAVKDVDLVLHTASPYRYNVDDNERDLLYPAVHGTVRLLEAVHASANRQIERVAITSSFAALVDVSKGYWEGKVYTESDWNPMTWDEAKNAGGGHAYCASKAFAEKAAWDFLAKAKPSFSITTLCPPKVYGPNAQHVESLDRLNTSSKDMWGLINGSQGTVPITPFPAFVDVRDLALAHKLALERPEAANKRFIISNGAYTQQDLADIIKDQFPRLHDRIPTGRAPELPTDFYKLSNERASKELGMQWTPLEDTVRRSVEEFLALEKRLSTKNKVNA